MRNVIVDSVVWRRRDTPGYDACAIIRTKDHFHVSGVAIFIHDTKPCNLRYEVSCGRKWNSVSAIVTGTIGRTMVNAEIRRTRDGWLHNGILRNDLEHCQDIDLSFTPATNVIPVRRSQLRPYQQSEASAVWLQFPSLKVTQLDQIYKNLGNGVYMYSTFAGQFRRRLRVRPSGLVSNYPGLWSLERASSD